MPWPCFLVEPTERYQLRLRRFCWADAQGGHYHDASISLRDETGEILCECVTKEGALTFAPRELWPAQCSCGYLFLDSDVWQVNRDRYYRAADGREFRLRHMPPGAMWRMPWAKDIVTYRPPDGVPLAVMLPDGTEWQIDAPSKGGGYWQRSGQPPNITCSPSIAAPGYHGFLQNGVLTDDLEGRKFR